MQRARRDRTPAEVGDDDSAVIRRSLREPERFGVIFDRHAPHIHRYLCRRLNAELADDLVGETFLAAFHSRERYDLTRHDARPWLYGIATNLSSRHRRAELSAYRLSQAVGPDPAEPSHADQVAADVTAQALRSLLVTALSELAPGDRDVLLLIAWEQLSYDEVAAALAIPVGTVRSRLHRARQQIRKTLGHTNPSNVTEEPVRHG
ncbi:RNA polymerase sigma factor [Micromonospora sp. NPDC049559]|uniref:RNA polymerase sigma factor n=1 Tax=Micromonospora sp. NPDC049559 TaxID=3155923 RepID=UPI003419F277